MQYHSKLVDVDDDEDMVMVVEGIPDPMVLMIVIPQIHIKRKSHYNIKKSSNTKVTQKKMGNVHEIDVPRTIRIIVKDDCSDFRRLLNQNTIYNLIHYSRAACTRLKMVLVQTTVV